MNRIGIEPLAPTHPACEIPDMEGRDPVWILGGKQNVPGHESVGVIMARIWPTRLKLMIELSTALVGIRALAASAHDSAGRSQRTLL